MEKPMAQSLKISLITSVIAHGVAFILPLSSGVGISPEENRAPLEVTLVQHINKVEETALKSVTKKMTQQAKNNQKLVAKEKASHTLGVPLKTCPPQIIKAIKPKYPKLMKSQNITGKVVLKVEVLSNGRVGRVEVVSSSGIEQLDKSALKSLKSWQFKPKEVNKKYVTSWVEVPIRFRIEEQV